MGSAVTKMIDVVMLGFINKLAGLVFGVLKAALILSIILLVFDFIDEDVKILPEDAKNESRMYAPIRDFAPSLLPFIDFWNDKRNEDSFNGDVV